MEKRDLMSIRDRARAVIAWSLLSAKRMLGDTGVARAQGHRVPPICTVKQPQSLRLRAVQKNRSCNAGVGGERSGGLFMSAGRVTGSQTQTPLTQSPPTHLCFTQDLQQLILHGRTGDATTTALDWTSNTV